MPWWAWTLIALAAVVGLIAVLGGFDEAPVEALPELELGQQFDGNEVTTTVTGTRLSDTAPFTGYDADDGEEYLIVEATVENVTTLPNLFADASLRVLVSGVLSANTRPDSVVDLSTGEYSPVLNPGLPAELAYVWPIERGAIADGDELIVGILERYDNADDPRFDDAKTAPVPVARIVTTVGER